MTAASFLTLLGALCGACGVALYPSPVSIALLGCSLAIDCLDGWMARALDQCTSFGASLDWWTDVIIGNGIVYALMSHNHPLAGALSIGAMLACQGISAATSLGIRASGRAFVTLIAALVWFAP